ncbi:MAG TPA: hypothetical protein PKW76_09860 [bacterium]|nr:hypothetical protein [bacterium]HOX84428.1 hypothetical protein [bacterium]HPG45975.1 hypothetical protein [bacterium]HPM97797.1 hypothetical protein [bacterium]
MALPTSDRQSDLSLNLEQCLVDRILDYPQHQDHFWRRDYSSESAYIESVASARQHWSQLLAPLLPEFRDCEIALQKVQSRNWILQVRHKNRSLMCSRVILPAGDPSGSLPLVICLHGIGGSPAAVLGETDTEPPSYFGYGRELIESGCAVLVPALLDTFAARARINRLALLLGSSVWGLELGLLRRLFSECLDRFPIDADRIGIWGLSMGGAYSLFWMPVEARLRVGVISGWFNHRCRKMAVSDPNYTCFLDSEEEHAFLPGWLRHFSDRDLASLICPRPLLIQSGRADSIADPRLVEEEFKAAQLHYQRLGIGDHLRWDLFDGGHCVRLASGLEFLLDRLNR